MKYKAKHIESVTWRQDIPIMGIYKISLGNYVYIGKSENIWYRWKQHLNMLTKNDHDNQYVQNVYNKHTKKLRFEIICTCGFPQLLGSLERQVFESYKADTSVTTLNIIEDMTGICGSGNTHSSADKTIYHWIHQDGREERLTKYDMYTKHQLHKRCITNVANGKEKSHKNWRLFSTKLEDCGRPSGRQVTNYDHTICTFQHIDTGEVWQGTRNDFKLFLGVKRTRISQVIWGKSKHCLRWKLV